MEPRWRPEVVVRMWPSAEASAELATGTAEVARRLAGRKRMPQHEADQISSGTLDEASAAMNEPTRPREEAELIKLVNRIANKYASRLYRARGRQAGVAETKSRPTTSKNRGPNKVENESSSAPDQADPRATSTRVYPAPKDSNDISLVGLTPQFDEVIATEEQRTALSHAVRASLNLLEVDHRQYASAWRQYFFEDGTMPSKRARAAWRTMLEKVFRARLRRSTGSVRALFAGLLAFFEPEFAADRDDARGPRHLGPLAAEFRVFLEATNDENPGGAQVLG